MSQSVLFPTLGGQVVGNPQSNIVQNGAVLAKILTGLTSVDADLLTTDTIIQAFSKVNGKIAGLESDIINKADNTYSAIDIVGVVNYNVVHNLNKYPQVSLIDSSGNFSIAEIIHNSLNDFTVNMNLTFTGKILYI